MAGGKGERFWPLSRTHSPKPFIRFTKEPSLIEKTFIRVCKFTAPENIFIATNHRYVKLIRKTLPRFPLSNIIAEPIVRDTAPCICLASALIASRAKSKNSVMVVLPADHLINDDQSFTSNINDAAKIATKSDSIVTIGIKPTSSSTAYGYIQSGEKINTNSQTIFKEGLSFVEKPELKEAKKFLKDGNYLWNAGIFLWSFNTFQKLLEQHNPNLYNHFIKLKEATAKKNFRSYIKKNFHKMEKISIDYALMEKLQNFIVAEANFDWDDIGSWDSIAKYFTQDEKKNRHSAPYLITVNSKNNIVADYSSKKHLIAILDTDDLIVITHNDATLICKTSSAQKLKELVNEINKNPKLSRFL